MKWQLIILVMLAIGIANALEECENVMHPMDIPCRIHTSYVPRRSCGNYSLSIFDNQNVTLAAIPLMTDPSTATCYQDFNYTDYGIYYFNNSMGDVGNINVMREVDTMASLAVMLFMMALTGAIFLIGVRIQPTKSIVANVIIKRSIIVFGIFFVLLDLAMIATIADNYGLGINKEIFSVMWFVQTAGWVGMAAIVFNTFFEALNLWKVEKDNRRMGNE